MKKILMSVLVLGTLMTVPAVIPPAGAQISLGIRIGPPPAPRRLAKRPRQPGPDYVWIEGYWYPNANGRSYKWHSGYWTRPPFGGARWIGPRYDGDRFFDGFWQDNNRREDHDHHNDRRRDRDYHR